MPPDPKPSDIVARYASATIDDLVVEHARDAGKGGLFLRASCGLAVGKLADFEVQLSNGEVALTGTGRIAWKREGQQGERPAGVAIRFVDLDDQAQGLVDRMLAKKGGTLGEFDQPPTAAVPAKTALGLGSPFAASPSSVDRARAKTMLGVSPVQMTPEAKERPATRLGLAPPVTAAGLVLGEQSSASVPVPLVRPQVTSDIDVGWQEEEPSTAKRDVVPPREALPTGAPGGAVASEIAAAVKAADEKAAAQARDQAEAQARAASEAREQARAQAQRDAGAPETETARTEALEAAAARAQAERRARERAPGAAAASVAQASAAKESRHVDTGHRKRAAAQASVSAESDLDAGRGGRAWPWIGMFILTGLLAAYLYRDDLVEQGIIPPIPGFAEGPPASTSVAPEPPPTVTSGPSAAPSPTSVPSASGSGSAGSAAVSAPAPAASHAPSSPSSASAPASAAPSTSAAASRGSAKAAASTKPPHGAPAASGTSKARSAPKPKSTEDNPY